MEGIQSLRSKSVASATRGPTVTQWSKRTMVAKYLGPCSFGNSSQRLPWFSGAVARACGTLSLPPRYAPGVLPTFNSCETAVSTCAGANGFAINTLFGTPNDVQSWPSPPVT